MVTFNASSMYLQDTALLTLHVDKVVCSLDFYTMNYINSVPFCISEIQMIIFLQDACFTKWNHKVAVLQLIWLLMVYIQPKHFKGSSTEFTSRY